MTKYKVLIARQTNTKDQKVVYIEQPDRINLAYSPKIPKGYFFMSASPEK